MGKRAAAKIEREAREVVRNAKAGNCTAALLHYADMQRARGEIDAHRESGGNAYVPVTTMQEAAYEFSTTCVLPVREGLSYATQQHAPIRKPKAPPPVFHPRSGPPPGVPTLKGARRRRRKR